MKIILNVFLLMLTLSAFGTVRTVSNNASRPAQFATFDAAQTASTAGDTIYLHGSPFAYPNLIVTKRLVIIGAGYNPNTQFGQPTNVANVELYNDSALPDPSGSVITGLLITGQLSCTGTDRSNNIRIFRCQINSSIYLQAPSSTFVDNWVIFNNIITNIYAGNTSRTSAGPTNIIIANNIIRSSVYYIASSSTLVDHNIFLGTTINNQYLFNVILSNNIYVRSSGTCVSNSVLCTYNNNLSSQSTIGLASEYSPTNNFVATFLGSGGGSNSGGGNQLGVDPLFQNVTDNNNYTNTFDYRLKAGSTGKNAGTDGTDLGIYGGSYPFPSGGGVGSGYDTSPMPPIPQVTEMNILNATVPVNGTLNVNVKAKVNN
jgi:hypothetical protein